MNVPHRPDLCALPRRWPWLLLSLAFGPGACTSPRPGPSTLPGPNEAVSPSPRARSEAAASPAAEREAALDGDGPRSAFRWQVRSLPGRALRAVWGSGPADGFAVGQAGTVLHYDGERWESQPSGTDQDLLDVWGSGPSDVIAVGRGGTVLRYDGQHWQREPSSTPMDLITVWGSGPRDVFAAGIKGTIVHYDGRRWQVQESGTPKELFGLSGSGPTDIYAVGYAAWGGDDLLAGWPCHRDPEQRQCWVLADEPSCRPLDEDGSVRGVLLHYDGRRWRPQTTLEGWYFDVWVTGPRDLFAVLGSCEAIRSDGRAWQALPVGASEGLFAVWGTGPSDLFFAGRQGTLIHFDGRSWRALPTETTAELVGIWASGPSDVFVVSPEGVLHGALSPTDEEDSGRLDP